MRRPTKLMLVVWCGLALVLPARGQDPDPTDPKTCKTIWADIGLPERPAGSQHDTTPVCHRGYIVMHGADTKTPDWAVEHLTAKIVSGANDRPGIKFKAEPAIDPPKAVPEDYKGSEYAIGHQAPSADFKSSDELMRDTFFLSNAVPQVGLGFNTGIWSSLEGLVQKLVVNRGELFVITGPVYQGKNVKVSKKSDACKAAIELPPPDDRSICAARNEDNKKKCDAGVAVPAALFKIIYDPGQGGRVNAFLLPNLDHRPLKQKTKTLDYLKDFQVGVNTVEDLTGYKFFVALPDRKQTQLKENCGATMLH